MTSRDKHVSTRSKIKGILHITLPLPLHCLQAPTCLVILLCSLQKRNLIPLRFLRPQQKSQIEVYQELTRSNKEKEHDALFTSIPVFDGDRTQCEQWLDDMDQATRISGRDLRTELIKKSTGVVRQVIMMAHPDASDDDLINIIREDFFRCPDNEMRPGRSCSTCTKNQKNKCVFTFTGMGTCIRGRQALGQLKRHTNM